MMTLDDLTSFSGEEGEDALRWYRSFISATNAFSERATLNHFTLCMEPYSLAQEWCDGLSDEVLSNWTAVDRHFQQRWLRHRGKKGEHLEKARLHHEGGKADAMKEFQKHHLTDDAIFSSTSGDVIAMNKVVVDWVERHAKLGDAALIETTIPYLPPFIRAFLKYESSPPMTFQTLCMRIKEITDPILEFEQLRRQEKAVEWQAEMEKKQDEIYKTAPDSEADEIDGGYVTEFFPTTAWRKTDVLLNQTEMVMIVKEAIWALWKYESSAISIDAARMIDIGFLNYCKAVEAPGQFQPNTVIGKAGTQSNVWLGLFQIRCQRALNKSDDATEATKIWESFNNSSHLIQGECIYKSNHTHFIYPPNNGTYGISSKCALYYGGLAQNGDNSTFTAAGVNTIKTALYLLLSGYLAERAITTNNAYNQAAIDSANWIQRCAYDDAAHLVKSFNYKIQDGCESVWGINSVSPYITGLFIEGLCVLADVTGEQKWRTLAICICDAAMVYRDWHDGEGIFKYVSSSGPATVDEANIFRGLLIRGLSVAYQRNPTNKALRRKIRGYVNVQFNALQDTTHDQGSYPVTWNGSSSERHAHGQMAALEVLMAATIVNHY